MTVEAVPQAERLCPVSNIADGGAFGVEAPVHGVVESVVLLRRGDEVRAFLNVCPHAGRRLDWAPDQFLISGDGKLVCAAHGATFLIPSGECVGGPCRGQALREVPIMVRDGMVYVAGPASADAPAG